MDDSLEQGRYDQLKFSYISYLQNIANNSPSKQSKICEHTLYQEYYSGL